MESFGSSLRNVGGNLKAGMLKRQLYFQLKPNKPRELKPRLPHELVLLIIGMLDDDSLRQCALAARRFLPHARNRTFGRIILKKEEHHEEGRLSHHLDRLTNLVRSNHVRRHKKSARLLALLESTPGLAELAKEFVIEGEPYNGRFWSPEDHLPLHQILPRLHNLETISLLFYRDNECPIQYFSETSCAAITQALHSPKIRRVAIENVSFSSIDTLLVFLRHAVAGGGLEELSITTWGQLNESIYPLSPPDTTPMLSNKLRSFQVNAPPRIVEEVLQWAKSEESRLSLDSLSRFEVVGAATQAQLNLVAQITSPALQSQHLRHLGIIVGEEATHPNLASSPSNAPNYLTRSLLSGLAQNLHKITFYAISDKVGRTALWPTPSSSLAWWITLFTETSLPTLQEFRIDRRGFCSLHILCPQHIAHHPRLVSRRHISPETYHELEKALYGSAPNAMLRIDLEASGTGESTLAAWKELYFPSNDFSHLKECFPFAHSPEEALSDPRLVIYLRARVKLAARSGRAKQGSVYEHGCFVYTPERRWIRLEGVNEDVYLSDVNARRTIMNMMESICETCKFTPSVQYPPVSRDQFRSEFAIPDATLIQMASIIEEKERHIEHCSSEILRVQEILRNLQNDKRALDKQVAQHRSYISPMRRVPHELWVEIFSICISEQQFRAESESKKMKRSSATDGEWRTMFATPFRLTGVCLRWRTIVSSTPAFWSTIFYNLHWNGRSMPGLGLYLERSEEHDLDISLSSVRCSSQRHNFEAEQRIEPSGTLAFRMLLDCMPRIRGLSAAASNVRLPFPDSQPPDCSFPRLRFLDVQERYSRCPAWFFDAARQATELERLVVHDSLGPKSPLGALTTRPSLKSLELSRVSMGEEPLNTILNLPHLESLTIGSINPPYRGQRPALAPRVMCSSLRYLTINGGSSSLELLQSLEMPNLQSLRLCELCSETSTPDDALLVLSKFAPKLQCFTLWGDYRILPGGKLMDLLQTLPNVVTFEFGGWYDRGDPAATASASTSIRTLFLGLITERPRLEYLSLSLVNISVTEEIFAALMELLEAWAQRRNTASLKCIRFQAVEFPQEGKRQLISRLGNWKDSGFKWALGNTRRLSEELVKQRKHEIITIRST
ncbi:hypothetical protein PQX77_018972 [Marasmius sp. AFHP31]|nr:hypothetical protein PQX77_018972 [Marasmius sp. AFHP31]